MSSLIRRLIGIFLICLPLKQVAAEPLILQDGDHRYTLEQTLQFYIDKQKQLTINTVVQGKHDDKFAHANKSTINFGFILQPVWLKFSIQNPTQHAKTLYIEINYPLINEVVFFFMTTKEDCKNMSLA